MTREEALNILNRDDDNMRKGYFCINDFKAIEVLKKALEQEEYYKNLIHSYERTIVKLTEAIAESEKYNEEK